MIKIKYLGDQKNLKKKELRHVIKYFKKCEKWK